MSLEARRSRKEGGGKSDERDDDQEALMTAGYSNPHSPAVVLPAIPKKVLRILGRGAKPRALGEIEPEDQEKLVLAARLVYNVIKGQDKGVNSAYRLGRISE